MVDPAACAEAYKANRVDIALVPVGALMGIGEYQMITDFCIGCDQEVRTVCLMSNQNIQDIHTIYWPVLNDVCNLPPPDIKKAMAFKSQFHSICC